MLNLLELYAENDTQAPCKHGNIVEDHACYCHDDKWKEGPRKCPVWRNFGISDLSKWYRREWEMIELPIYRTEGISLEKIPHMPDDGLGGCPHFNGNMTVHC